MALKKDYFGDASKALNQEESYTPGDAYRISQVSDAIKHLQNFKQPFAATQLTAREVMLFSQAEEIARLWDWDIQPILRDLAIKKMSEGRKSREEIKDTLTGLFKGGKKSSRKGFYAPARQEENEA